MNSSNSNLSAPAGTVPKGIRSVGSYARKSRTAMSNTHRCPKYGRSAHYTISSKLSGKLLDASVASGSDGAAVIQWIGNGGDNQKWRFTETQ